MRKVAYLPTYMCTKVVNMWFLEDLHVLYIDVVNGSVLFTKAPPPNRRVAHKQVVLREKKRKKKMTERVGATTKLFPQN